jgi:hypothetical protein
MILGDKPLISEVVLSQHRTVGNDCSGGLGGDGSMGRYCGAVSSPLVRSCGGIGVVDV